MNSERLLKLADLLEADAARPEGIKFDLGIVIKPEGPINDDEKVVKVDCGTHACAMGLAVISRAFTDAGLDYVIDHVWETIDIQINGESQEWDEAAGKIFGLAENEVEFLFTTQGYPGEAMAGADAERQVAQRIRELVAGTWVAPPLPEDWWDDPDDYDDEEPGAGCR